MYSTLYTAEIPVHMRCVGAQKWLNSGWLLELLRLRCSHAAGELNLCHIENYRSWQICRVWHPSKHRSSSRLPCLLSLSKFSLLFLLGLFSFSCSSSFISLRVPLVPALVIPLFLSSFNPPVAVEQLETGAHPDAVWLVGLFFSFSAC